MISMHEAWQAGGDVLRDAVADGHCESATDCWEFWAQNEGEGGFTLPEDDAECAAIEDAFRSGHAAALAIMVRPIEEVLGIEAQQLFPGAQVLALGTERSYQIFPANGEPLRWLADAGDGGQAQCTAARLEMHAAKHESEP